MNHKCPHFRGIFCFVDRIFGRILLGFITIYRSIFSLDHSFWARALARPPYCKHIPSCSSYALVAIERFWGVYWGWITLKRLGRCVPWRMGWYDPVPESIKSKHSSKCQNFTKCQCITK